MKRHDTALRILHISDTHLFGDDTRHYGVVDTDAALRRTLERADAVPDVDVLVASGDLSDDGSVSSYRRLRELTEQWGRRHDAQVVYAMGNHDVRAGYEEVLGERRTVAEVGGVRILTLDSAVPGAGYGLVPDEDLGWLRQTLEHDPQRASVVVVHHPPTPAWGPLLQALELQNAEALREVCAAGGVGTVLSGHYHHPLATVEDGIPIVVAPGVANTSDPCARPGHERATVGSGFAVVDVAADGSPTSVFIGAPSEQDGTELFDLTPDEVARIAAAAGPDPAGSSEGAPVEATSSGPGRSS